MKYFIDTEFIEGFKKPLFGKRRHFIDLISIGIKAEDGREYYAISNEFNPNDADEWVCVNVLGLIYDEYIDRFNGNARNVVLNAFRDKSIPQSIRIIQEIIGKSNEKIADEIKEFVLTGSATCDKGNSCCISHFDKSSDIELINGTHHDLVNIYEKDPISFYAYYADYDWVLFCSLFGRMIDLPKGFPMYCNDLKQSLDDKALSLTSMEASKIKYPDVPHDVFNYLDTLSDKSYKIDALKQHINYPAQDNEHSALDDAKWNFELYKFLKTL